MGEGAGGRTAKRGGQVVRLAGHRLPHRRPDVIEWDPHTIDLTAADVSLQSLSETDADDRLRCAKAWLYNFLESGPRFGVDVKSAAKQAGISTEPLWAAKKALKVVSVRPENTKDPAAKRFEWRLPKDDYFREGETEMLLTPTCTGGLPPELLGMIANLNDPSWGEALGGGRGWGAGRGA